MVIANSDTKINVICSHNYVLPNKTPILFLHGFTGSAEDWSFITNKLNDTFFPIAIDLPGHGKTETNNTITSYSTNSHIKIVESVFSHFNISKAIIVGYSMGGRTALSFAVKNPKKVVALILESSTAGIENKVERDSRIKIDSEIADNILIDGIDTFVQYWLDLPFFKSLKSLSKKEHSHLVEQKRKNSTTGLANSLKGFSTGKMPSLWCKLNKLSFPTLLIAGRFDRKYVRINEAINQAIQNSELSIVENCGHNTHLENPKEFTILVNSFFNNLDYHETQLAKS